MKKTKKMTKSVKNITLSAMIAACYIALTYIFAFAASGAVQVRVAEALCTLPYFTPAAIPGLAVGCLVSNILTGCSPLDIIFGTGATLVGAVGSYLLRRNKYLVSIPPVLANTIVIPQILKYVYHTEGAFWLITLSVFLGEVISVTVLGTLLLKVLEKHEDKLFK